MAQYIKLSLALGAITDGMHPLLVNFSKAINYQEPIFYQTLCLILVILEKKIMLEHSHY